MDLYLGIDFGTSGCRAVVINKNREAVCNRAITTSGPAIQGERAEQTPSQWWQTLLTLLTQLGDDIDLGAICAVSVNGTSGTVIICDNQGIPLTDALMYNDQRAQQQARVLGDIAPDGSPVLSSSSSLAKIMWLQGHGMLKNCAYIQHQADWISNRLSGQFGISDINNCLKLGYDTQQNRWPPWLRQLPIATNLYPKVVLPGTPIGYVLNSQFHSVGIKKQTLVIAGTTDSTAAVIASGASKLGDAITSLGSTLVVKTICDSPITSSKYGVYSQPLYGRWLVGGASNSGGAVLRHYFSLKQIQQFSNKIRPDRPTGLNYYPLINVGERFPINDPNMIPKLTPRPAEELVFFQGILEGIAMIEKRAYDRLTEFGATYPTHVFTNGGGAVNSAWTAIRSRLLNIPVSTALNTDAAYGSALLALQGYNNATRLE